jgi:hypothetical protein
MNKLLGLKLLLMRHGKCAACKDRPRVKHCGVCFNTRLEPEVLEAITTLDLAEKFKEHQKRIFETLSEDNYFDPPEGSYFYHVIQKKEKLERLYSEFVESGASRDLEKEVFRRLLGELLGVDGCESVQAQKSPA